MPAAPPLFSVTTGLLSAIDMDCAYCLPNKSVGLPGGEWNNEFHRPIRIWLRMGDRKIGC